MKDQVYRFISAIFLTVLALLGLGAALHTVVTLPLQGKGPEWIGAIGTVATLIGTIWLATTGERKRKREQLDLAIIAAAEFALWIPRAQLALHQAIAELPDARSGAYGQVYTRCADHIRGADIWGADALRPLVHVPDHAAAKLAFNAVRIKSLGEAFRDRSETMGMSLNQIKMCEDAFSRQLRAASDELRAPLAACRAFLDKHGFTDL